jgi:hypothetical protein
MLVTGLMSPPHPAGRVPGLHTALKLLMVPLYVSALLQPHAVLLYWGAHGLSSLGVAEAAQRGAARVPPALLSLSSRPAERECGLGWGRSGPRAARPQ